MTTTTTRTRYEDFEADALRSGYDTVMVRDWAPGTVVADHAHPFAAHALLVQGEMWLMVGEQTQHLRPGDSFDLAPHVMHSERYGPDGATYWVARRNAP